MNMMSIDAAVKVKAADTFRQLAVTSSLIEANKKRIDRNSADINLHMSSIDTAVARKVTALS